MSSLSSLLGGGSGGGSGGRSRQAAGIETVNSFEPQDHIWINVVLSL